MDFPRLRSGLGFLSVKLMSLATVYRISRREYTMDGPRTSSGV
jgi:hypothetical protein